MVDREYYINEFLSLKLKGGKTHIYVGGKKFRQCKYLFLINPQSNERQEEVMSIDEAAEELRNSLESKLIYCIYSKPLLFYFSRGKE